MNDNALAEVATRCRYVCQAKDDAWDSVRALERQAGIGDRCDRAREGTPLSFNPAIDRMLLERPDRLETEKAYVDYATRSAYFSVQDEGLRKKLISAQTEFEEVLKRSFELDLAWHEGFLSQAVLASKSKLRFLFRWSFAAFLVLAAPYFGRMLFPSAGLAIGLTLGVLLAYRWIVSARNSHRVELAHRRALVSNSLV